MIVYKQETLKSRVCVCVYVCVHKQGQRALGFVLSNKGMIDKTLLFDIGGWRFK